MRIRMGRVEGVKEHNCNPGDRLVGLVKSDLWGSRMDMTCTTLIDVGWSEQVPETQLKSEQEVEGHARRLLWRH